MFLTGISWKVYDVNRFINVIVLMEILYPMYYNLIKYIIKFERYESTQNILPWKNKIKIAENRALKDLFYVLGQKILLRNYRKKNESLNSKT